MVIMTMKIRLRKSLMKLRRTKICPRLASNFGQPEASCNGGQFLTILMCWSALSNFEVKCTKTLLGLKTDCGLCGVRKGICIFDD